MFTTPFPKIMTFRG